MPTTAELADVTGADPLTMWAAERPGASIWAVPGAAVVAAPGLSRRDRLVVHGEPGAVAALLGKVLPEVGPSFRPLGAEELVVAVAERVPGLSVAGRFAWMETSTPPGEPNEAGEPRWLREGELGEAAALLAEAFPASYAQVGAAGVARWAGLRDEGGRLVAIAADAWSSPRTGFLAGVTTRPGHRGRGRAATLCSFVVRELLRGRERVALFADYDNVAAVATYRKLGFALGPLAAAHQVS
ncbi:hypothetical protein Aab01nite_27260 [Paractinoplanes abujensis]|uniref:Ribosomal protein S18 acetylase RimI-like enzyme n=1 Tax=Paractinoplanes abujensis TaxID=882441 RepID=A0A7W7G5E4_9ACTN|nr:GNAT family N-acetyltransferase [Actinoplanes abujensis]MBB4698378.1 ribosomal protein S18 acetylase RimI-like enzyme [Actinoplanes abujensis]GID19136.1 hypothetical protein Aab01nite_27260 [Actinoplanes abujensis]